MSHGKVDVKVAITLVVVGIGALFAVFQSMDTAADAAADIDVLSETSTIQHVGITESIRVEHDFNIRQDGEIERQGETIGEMRDDLKQVQRDVTEIKEQTSSIDAKLGMLLER